MNFRAEGIKKASENDRLKLCKTRLTGFEFKRNISQPSYIKNGKVLLKIAQMWLKYMVEPSVNVIFIWSKFIHVVNC